MSKHAGIWIDHKMAVIISSVNKVQSMAKVKSGVEGHYRIKGGAHSKASIRSTDATAESRREGRYKHHLQEYYKRVIDTVRDCDSIFVFGPGEAKHEFVKELGREKALAGKIAGVETADKMTEPQIKAKVKKYFMLKA